MRYWYDSDNLSWTSNDGYEIWLDSDIKGYKLFSPDGFCLGVWFCDDLREQIGDLDIKLYEYMFYKAERFLTVIGIKIEEALNKAVCTRDYSVKHCGKCIHLIFKNYKRMSGTCSITGLEHYFEDRCDHDVYIKKEENND